MFTLITTIVRKRFGSSHLGPVSGLETDPRHLYEGSYPSVKTQTVHRPTIMRSDRSVHAQAEVPLDKFGALSL